MLPDAVGAAVGLSGLVERVAGVDGVPVAGGAGQGPPAVATLEQPGEDVAAAAGAVAAVAVVVQAVLDGVELLARHQRLVGALGDDPVAAAVVALLARRLGRLAA